MSEPDSESKLFAANDGLNLYRALSYFEVGDDTLAIAIRDRVIVHLEESLRNSSHAYHERCKTYVRQHSDSYGQEEHLVKSAGGRALTASLRRAIWKPDGQSSGGLLSLVSEALQVCIDVTKPGCTRIRGLNGWPRCKLSLILVLEYKGCMVNAVSVPCHDTDGSTLTRHLQLARTSGEKQEATYAKLDFEKISWSWRCRPETSCVVALDCKNEYRGRPHPITQSQDDDAPDGSLEISTVCVSKPDQIPAALRLLKDAIHCAPGQGVAKRFDKKCRQRRVIKPYVGVDAEFIKRFDEPAPEGLDEDEAHLRPYSEYVSVLTFAVDKHLVVMFYVMHMIDNAHTDTVPMLLELFKGTIFDTNLLKVWHNFQEDIRSSTGP